MLIIRNPNGLVDGKMISYGGYKWFKKVFEKKTNNEEVFIQKASVESKLGNHLESINLLVKKWWMRFELIDVITF